MTDFYLRSFGSVAMITAKSEAAKEFARENFAVEGWQGTPEHFSTDWRAAQDLAARLSSEGWTVVEP